MGEPHHHRGQIPGLGHLPPTLTFQLQQPLRKTLQPHCLLEPAAAVRGHIKWFFGLIDRSDQIYVPEKKQQVRQKHSLLRCE